MDEGIDGLLDSPDDDLDDLDLGDEFDVPPTPAGAQTTKACPYCGEQVLAVAIKCKHCGSYVAELTQQPGASDAMPASPLRAVRKKPSLPWLAIGGGVAGLVVLASFSGWPLTCWHESAVGRPDAASRRARPAARAEQEAPKPAHSPEELAFAAKLVAFLDACDETAKLLQGSPQPEKCAEQTKVIRDRWAEVPAPPSGVAWAAEAAASARHFVELAEGITRAHAEFAGVLDLIGGGTGSSPEARDACAKPPTKSAASCRKFAT